MLEAGEVSEHRVENNSIWSKTLCEYMLGQILIINLLILPVL